MAKTRVVTLTYVVVEGVEDSWTNPTEVLALSPEEMERWLWDSNLDLRSQAAAPDVRLYRPSSVSVVDVEA